MKRIFASISLSLIAGSVFAYTVGQELTIENKTNTDMVVNINKLYNQAAVTRDIPAHTSVKIYTENGDNSALLYQLGTAQFAISDKVNSTAYIKGNISFYVGATHNEKYSFLNQLHAGSGINLDQSYSCLSQGSGNVFNNKIVIGGNPSTPTYDKPADNPSSHVRCHGILSSTLNEQLSTYEMNCASNPEHSKLLYAVSCYPGPVTNDGRPTTRCAFKNLNTGSVGSTSTFICTKDIVNCTKKFLDIQLGETRYCPNVFF